MRGRNAYVFGISQSGRFLRQFLHDGFNADERDRRAFDLVWAAHRRRRPGLVQRAVRDAGLFVVSCHAVSVHRPRAGGRRRAARRPARPLSAALQPKVIYTNTPVEYWGQGRAAALTHTSLDGTRDLTLPDNVRSYLLAGTQHGEAAFPPAPGQGQELGNPMPQGDVMRALLRAGHRWVSARNCRAAQQRYPTLRARIADDARTTLRFPAIPGVADPRTRSSRRCAAAAASSCRRSTTTATTSPASAFPNRPCHSRRRLAGTSAPNGSATRTTIVALTGSYIPFARTRGRARGEPAIRARRSRSGTRARTTTCARIRAAAMALVKSGYMLAEDVDGAVAARRAALGLGDDEITVRPFRGSRSVPVRVQVRAVQARELGFSAADIGRILRPFKPDAADRVPAAARDRTRRPAAGYASR